MADQTLASMTAATAATGGLLYGTQSGNDRKFTATAAGATLLEAASAAAQVVALNALTSGGALGTPSSGTLTNCTFPTLNQNTTGYASGLKSATTTVGVSAATAPTSGQVLTATSGTAATWQTPSAGGTIATPRVYYVESTGNDGTGAVGNPALPYATGTAAYNAGVTAAVPFVIKFGVGVFTIAITADITDFYFRQAIGVGSGLTILTISGSPADAETGQAGYATTFNIELLDLTINCPGGNATGIANETGGGGSLHAITGSNCRISAIAPGGNAADGSGGVGGTLRFDGQFKVVLINVSGGTAGPSGTNGSEGGLEMDGCDLRACSYTAPPLTATFGRCSYTGADITPGTALACAAY